MRPALSLVALMFATPALAEYELALVDTGKRDYYCTITVELIFFFYYSITEIYSFFLNYIGDELVGRSKGSSFMNVAPGASASATFETPNAPCTEVDTYEPIIGACRLGVSFEDKSVCVEKLSLEPPFKPAIALN